MELLEREGVLAALAEAHASAAGGKGRAVVVLGEAGMGKTAVAGRFLEALGPHARVLRGTCDDLATPRPLGPLHDMAPGASDGLRTALADGTTPHAVHGALLEELATGPGPTVVLIEDIHWADDATLDALTVLIRRIGSLPVLLLLTCRDGEAPPGHPIRYALGSARPDEVAYVTLAPLSRSAVASLAGERADAVYAASHGNPLFVRELLAAPGEELPPTIANAVLARTTRLPDDAQRLLALVSVVPNRAPTSLLDAVLPDWADAAAEPERRGLLAVDARFVHFRHELTRNAVRASLPLAEQRRLHAAILAALLAAGSDPAEIVHHAEGAGDERVVAEHAVVAARGAAAVGANREAFAHYRRAAELLDGRDPREQAVVLEEAASAAQLAGRIEEAFPLVGRATELFQELGDVEAVGRCTRKLARFRWFAGEGEVARVEARRAIELLEPGGESVELARAYAGLSAVTMLTPSFEEALLWGGRALDLATRLGDEQTRAHALVNLGTTRVQLDPRLEHALLEAHRAADAAGDPHEAARAIGNLAGNLEYWGEGAAALRYAEKTLAYAEHHEVLNIAHYVSLMIAELRARQGAWEEAELVARLDLEAGRSVASLVAETIVAELAVRQGTSEAEARLEEAERAARRSGDLQRTVPVLDLRVEHALLHGTDPPHEQLATVLEQARGRGGLAGWVAVRLAACAALVGGDVTWKILGLGPYARVAVRDWRGAADAFGAVGWRYDRALMLSLLDDEDGLLEALATARALGAEPLVRRITERLRAGGRRVPAGPRETTRANPAGLTARQLEVLALVAEGLTNAEIADRLVVSQRTAEHHVGAVLQKLGAPTRRDAARRAAELGSSERGEGDAVRDAALADRGQTRVATASR